MKFLFSHRNYPGQFKHILLELAKNKDNEIVFLTNKKINTKKFTILDNIKIITYGLKREVPRNCHRYLRQFEEAIIHGQAAAEELIRLKNVGFIPDIMYAHFWGNSLFFKDIFPNTPLISYCEWYYNFEGSDIDFEKRKHTQELERNNGRNMPDYDKKARLRCDNSNFLLTMLSSDKLISPTVWQKEQFPNIFKDRIEVIHDGIDTEYFRPNPDIEFKIPNSDIVLGYQDEVLTYATRGMEPYRGFPEFMEATCVLLKKRPNLRVLIAGKDGIYYGPKLRNSTYKEIMLKRLDFGKEELKRLHFVGNLPYNEYLKLFQVSSAHCYLTYPFVLSWSFLEAMAVGCCIVSSKTPPVEEIMKDGYNGLLVDFYDVQGLINTIEYALDNRNKIQDLRGNARKTVVEKYELRMLLKNRLRL